MMNLELFFVGETLTGNHTYRQHAISHADKTMQNHVRADGTCRFLSFVFGCMRLEVFGRFFFPSRDIQRDQWKCDFSGDSRGLC